MPLLTGGSLEVSLFGTFSFGSSLSGLGAGASSPGLPVFTIVTPSSNGGGGVQVAGSLRRRVRLYGEWAYIAGGRIDFNQDYVTASDNSTNRRSLHADTSSYNAHGGIQILFPVQRTPSLVPYLDGAFGVLASRGGASAAIIGGAPGQSFSGTIQTHRALASAGIGARYYFTERAGLRFELKGFFGPSYQAASGSAGDLVLTSPAARFGRVAFGFFYQLR